MRKTILRGAGLAALLAGGIAAAQQIQVQVAQPVPALPTKPGEKKKAASVEVMTFPQDRDAKNMIQAVIDYVKEYQKKPETAPWEKICQAAQTVLDAKSDSFFELPKKGDSPQGRVSAKAEINRLIGEFPKEGRQFYQLSYGATAENLLAQGIANNYDRATLADVSQRYFHTKAGAQATLLLGAVSLDRGNYVEAAYCYERLMARPDSDELWNPLTTFKAIAAMKRAGASNTNATAVSKLMEKLERGYPRDGIVIGRRSYTIDELKEELKRESLSLNAVSDLYISMRLGNASHTSLLDGGKPFLDPDWSQSLFRRKTITTSAVHQGNLWVNQNLEDVLKTINPQKGESAITGFFPATAQNLVFFRSYDGVYCYVTKDGFLKVDKPARAGDLNWFAPLSGSTASLWETAASGGGRYDGFRKEDLERNWRYFRDQAQLKTLLFDNPLNGTMSHDGRAVYAVDDAGLPPPPPQMNDEFGGFAPIGPNANPATAARSRGFLSGNFLVALDIRQGNQLWKIGDLFTTVPLKEEEEEKTDNTLLLMEGSFFLGPPMPLNGKLYVLYERSGVIRLACLDPNVIKTHIVKNKRTTTKRIWMREVETAVEVEASYPYPALVWSQRLGEPNSRLPADTLRRFQGSFLAFSDGVMICPTNAGAVVAVDIMSRSLLWARSYRTLNTTSNVDESGRRLGGRVFINGPGGVATAGGASTIGKDRWRAAAPIISNGRVVFAAFDSKDIFCLDLRTGEVLWKEGQKTGDLYVGGLMGDNVLIVGKDSMRAVKLVGTPKKEAAPDAKEDVAYAWKDLKIGLPAGHGVASKDGVYYLPVAWNKDDEKGHPQVWAIDAAKGEVIAKAAYRKKDLSEGKPMLGNLVFHEGQLYSQSPTELTVFPLIELKKAEMNRLLAANPKDPEGLVARGEMNLDEGNVAAAIEDFAAARKNNPSEGSKARLHDKLFLCYTELLRKDFNAAEKYLDEYKTLCVVRSDAEDPNLLLKQKEENDRRQRLFLELLAKGREAQGRFTEAFDTYREFARYGGNRELVSLSDESNGKTRPDLWARGRIDAMIRSAKDESAKKSLMALVDREWSTVKGGAEVAKLREFVTIFGQHFAVGREAELLLGEKLLAMETEDATREAQAVLARLAATSEDPVLAARAIENLAKLAVRKGMTDTAVSYYSTLGTRYADTPLRANVTGADLLNGLLTDKRLLPHLEPARLPTPARVTVKREINQNNYNYVQTGYVIEPDGGGDEPFFRRHRIVLGPGDGGAGMSLKVYDRGSNDEKWKNSGLQMYNPNNTLSHRIAQARGNLMLLHLGFYVYCFDLAEKKRLWEYPILGEGKTIDFNNVQAQNGPDDELILTFAAENTKLTIGRSTILETNYAAIVTRDGLVALDPATKSKLWTRTNVSPSALIFGDARHVFVVEEVGGKRSSKVLRAVDGTLVADIPDFADLVKGSSRVRIVGRNILLADGGRTKPLTLRLYDPLTAKDVWKKEYAPMPEPKDYKSTGLEFNGQAKLIRTFSNDLTGAFERSGKFEVLDSRTGKVVFQSRIDEKNTELHASMTSQPVLLGDTDRYYLVLNKTAETTARNNNNVYYGYGGYGQLRTMTVTGPIYCFEKATAKRAWYTDFPKLFENQQLIIERFGEIPALVAATYINDDDDPNVPMLGRGRVGNNMVYRVTVVDKVNGHVRLWENQPGNGQFYAIDTDPKNATAILHGQDNYRGGTNNLKILPDDGLSATPKSAPKSPPIIMPTPAP